MISGAQRASLAADRTVGVGNLIHQLVTQDRVVDEPLLWADWRSPWGETFSAFSLLDLKRAADRCAAWYHGLGVRPRDPVAVYSGMTMDHVVHVLGLNGLGAVPLLVHGGLRLDVAVDLMRRVRVVGAFAAPEQRSGVAERIGAELRFLTGREDGAPAAELPSWYPFRHDDGDPVLITHTSGTTGAPKAVPMTHQGFMAGHRHRLRLPLAEGSERMLAALPPCHNLTIALIVFALLTGVQLRQLDSLGPALVLPAIEEYRASMLVGFARVFADLSESDLDAHDLSSLKLWFNSGDAMHESQVQKLVTRGSHYRADRGGVRRVAGSMFVDCLGSSEMGHNLFSQLHRTGTETYGRCIGRPFGFVEAAIVTDDGDPVPSGRIGRLAVKSPTLTPGYWNDSVQTWRSRLRGYFLTGDLAWRDEAGQFYHVDRATDAIVTPRGTLYTVLAEERMLAAHPDLVDCTLIGVREDASGEVEPIAFVHVRDGVPFDAAVWKRRLDAVLEAAEMPTVAKLFRAHPDQLPLTVTGKVSKARLRESWRELVAGLDGH
jgi:acyl-coenzyme A synthetase/AMP-(fatty) acid ligase